MLEPDRNDFGRHPDPLLDRVIEDAFALARSHLLENDKLPLTVVLEGSGRTAKLHFAFDSVAERLWAYTRTRLMATALAADACACAFPSSLVLGSGRSIEAIAVMAESRAGSATKLAAIRRHWKTRAVDLSIIDTPLADTTGTGPSSFLTSLIKPCSPAPNEAEAAWRRLAMLGVEATSGSRSTQ